MSIDLIELPFRHAVLEDYWDPDLLHDVFSEFPPSQDGRWIRYNNQHEMKLHGDTNCWGPRTLELLDAFRCLTPDLSEAFGIPDLRMETVGGGMHLIPPGGKLDIHTDFNRSPDTNRYRRLNLMCYLNDDWDDLDGGCLELWSDQDDTDVVRYEPEFNTTVIFESSDVSWHGHPITANRYRLSVAAYYFSDEPPPGYTRDHSTIWMFP